MWKLGLCSSNSFSGNICFQFTVLVLCSAAGDQKTVNLFLQFGRGLTRYDGICRGRRPVIFDTIYIRRVGLKFGFHRVARRALGETQVPASSCSDDNLPPLCGVGLGLIGTHIPRDASSKGLIIHGTGQNVQDVTFPLIQGGCGGGWGYRGVLQ